MLLSKAKKHIELTKPDAFWNKFNQVTHYECDVYLASRHSIWIKQLRQQTFLFNEDKVKP